MAPEQYALLQSAGRKEVAEPDAVDVHNFRMQLARPETRDAALMVLAGRVNKSLVAALGSHGQAAVGLSGPTVPRNVFDLSLSLHDGRVVGMQQLLLRCRL